MDTISEQLFRLALDLEKANQYNFSFTKKQSYRLLFYLSRLFKITDGLIIT